MFKNLIITICTILATASYTLANPIPVFCMAGWLDACKFSTTPNNYSASNNYYIKEYDYPTDQPLKYYSGSSDYIKEYDYKTDQPLKYYSGSGGYIKEYDYKTDQPLKYYFF